MGNEPNYGILITHQGPADRPFGWQFCCDGKCLRASDRTFATRGETLADAAYATANLLPQETRAAEAVAHR
jgi:hypothetical protein